MADDRISIPDPVFMRKAGRRAVRALVIILVLTALFTVGGISAIAHGEPTGIPLAVGGFALDIACIALVVAAARVPRTLEGHTIARSAVQNARTTTTWVRRGAWLTVLALLAYGVARVAVDDPWSFLVALAMSAALIILAQATRTLTKAQDRTLSGETA
jgi:hypothetical protein